MKVRAYSHPNRFLLLSKLILAVVIIAQAQESENCTLLSQTDGACRTAFIEGDVLYYGAGCNFRTADPAAPQEISVFPVDGYAKVVESEGEIAYVGSDDGVLYFYDLSDPADPVIACFYDHPAGMARDIVVDEGIAYIAAGAAGCRRRISSARVIDLQPKQERPCHSARRSIAWTGASSFP